MITNVDDRPEAGCQVHGPLSMCFACRSHFCYDCIPLHNHGSDVKCYVCADKGCRKCIERKITEMKQFGTW